MCQEAHEQVSRRKPKSGRLGQRAEQQSESAGTVLGQVLKERVRFPQNGGTGPGTLVPCRVCEKKVLGTVDQGTGPHCRSGRGKEAVPRPFLPPPGGSAGSENSSGHSVAHWTSSAGHAHTLGTGGHTRIHMGTHAQTHTHAHVWAHLCLCIVFKSMDSGVSLSWFRPRPCYFLAV